MLHVFYLNNRENNYILLMFPFCSQRIEAKEKEDAVMPTKTTGKGKALKVKQETLPTPQGRRVIPRVTSTMKAEANKKKGAGKKVKVCIEINYT